ncbi:MAG TPA: NAD(P)H-dependent oxidoreductase [Prolixibacteraceae bacterium]|nr:NAD(P)H-dependent oxidoreductase [Prolixibacteraceae bacterium]
MNVLIVYCHPSKKSFTFQIFDNLVNGLKASNHNIIVSDLYDMDFKTDMSELEYEREGFALIERPLSDDVVIEQEKIQKSDCVIFVYPVWWSDCPAKLKGWFDRVYSVGYAYGYNQSGKKQVKLKKQKLGLALCTAGHPNEFLDEIGIAESMRKVMIEDRLGQRFANKQMVIFGGTLDIEKVKDKHLMKAYEIGENIENYLALHLV